MTRARLHSVVPFLGLWVLIGLTGGCGSEVGTQIELTRVRSGGVDVVVLSADEALNQGTDALTLIFVSASDGAPVDVGSISVSPSMPMPGMMMFGDATVTAEGDVPGRYRVETDLEMAGSWRLAVRWDGPVGTGDATLPIAVR